MDENIYAIPTIALRGLVVFPDMVLHFDIARQKSVNAINAATDYGQEIFLVTQKDATVETPDFSDCYKLGVIARIRQVIRVPDSKNIRVIVEGVRRATIEKGYDGSFLYADVKLVPDRKTPKKDENYSLALLNKAREYFTEYAHFNTKIAPDVLIKVNNDDNPGSVADYIASVIPVSYEKKQKVLETRQPLTRLENLCAILKSEIELKQLENEIAQKVEKSMDENQREYYLREQMKALSEELDGPETINEIDEYNKKIDSIKNLDDKSREKLKKEVVRLQKMGQGANAESAVVRTYLDTVLSLPWDTHSKDRLDVVKAGKVLDRDHYGLESVKERIIELLAVRQLNPDVKGQIICLAGPPGVGKTSIGRSLAEALGRKYERISLGGVRDEAEIRGHRKTYIGAMPGRIMNAIIDAGTDNPLILFDEIDKMGADVRGDPASAMLEVLDAEQNKAFVDHYIELPFDLSKVLFITTANNKANIPAPLLDRMEVIDLYSYTAEEKFFIAKKHLIPKALKANGIKKEQLKITDGAIRAIISDYTREAGVRILERKINTICRKTALEIVKDAEYKKSVKQADLKDLLGTPKYKESLELSNEVGVTNGLAWTQVGGEMLQVEASVMSGTGRVELTGSLGDVMKESAMAAVSYIRSNAGSLSLEDNFYKEKDIHIHVPEGAVPKDGPSAGVTIATSVYSALSGKQVNGSVAMTGEISLTGKVMPIGGLREKSMAAYKAGIKTVLIPKDNVPDLDDVDKVVLKHIEFVPVSHISDVWNRAIVKV